MRRFVPVTVRTPEQMAEVAEHYASVDEFVFDVETVGKRRGNPQVNRVTWLGLACEGRTDVIPMGHPLGELIEPEHSVKEPFWDDSKVGKRGKPLKQWRTVRIPAEHTPAPSQLYPEQVWGPLEDAFFSGGKRRRKIGHGVKFDLESIAKYYGGKVPPPSYGDTLVVAHILNSRLQYGLKDIVKRLWDHVYDEENIAKPDKNGENGVEVHPYSKVARYTYLDVYYTWRIWKLFEGVPAMHRLDKVLALEQDVLPVLLSMEMHGVPIETSKMRDLSEVLTERIVEVEKTIFSAAGEVFNLNSTLQKQKFVYETRGHEVFARTDTGQPSTAAGVIESFAGTDPAVKALLEHAKIAKLLSTYVGEIGKDGKVVGGLPDFIVNQGRGPRIHADFVQYGADTGRFSCRKPNLQNIPRRAKDPESKAIRTLFVADPGHLLVVADYSQIEYRVLAHFSGDPTLTRAFLEGYDPHAATMALLLDKDIEDVSEEERDAGKTTNFAEIYGAGPGTIAANAGVSIQRAKWIRATYRKRFPRVQEWKYRTINDARRAKPRAHVRTLTGRVRYLPALLARDDGPRYAAERQAVNTRVQGSAADIIKIAMVRLHNELEYRYESRAKIILQVHDELMVMAPEDVAEEVKDTVQEIMEGVNLLKVPMVAEAKVGRTWAEAK